MSDTVKGKKTSKAASTQLFLPIAEIRDDTVVLKNGGIRAVLNTSSVNFNLKSESEQEAIIDSFQGFLNTLDFPIQILVKSKKLDVFKYLEHLKEIAETHENPLLKKQTIEYREYIKKLVEYADIMEKTFYVIVPYDPPRAQSVGAFTKFMQYLKPKDSIENIRLRHREFENLKKGLSNRVNGVKTALTACRLRVDMLDTAGLINLFYSAYNPLTSRNEKLRDVDTLDLQSI